MLVTVKSQENGNWHVACDQTSCQQLICEQKQSPNIPQTIL